MITLTCGHSIDNIDRGISCSVKGYTRENTPCVHHVVYCEGCYMDSLEAGEVLITEADEMTWLKDNE